MIESINIHWVSDTGEWLFTLFQNLLRDRKLRYGTSWGIRCSILEVFITEEVRTTEITMFSCAVCDKLFSTKYNMKRHVMSHSVNQIWCSACNQYFESQAKSDGRIASKHETYIWKVGDVIFKWKNSLNGHKLHHNENNKSYMPK